MFCLSFDALFLLSDVLIRCLLILLLEFASVQDVVNLLFELSNVVFVDIKGK